MMARNVLTLGVLLLPACGLGSGRSDANPFRAAESGRLSIVVENRNSASISVAAVTEERRITLGTVGGGARATYLIPWPGEQAVRFAIRLGDESEHETTPVLLEAGRIIELWVQDPIELSVLRE